ncbi:MAG: histidine kinase [Bacteroidia bacterium]|nr:histidine kinase [Bacteroidia bacterium]
MKKLLLFLNMLLLFCIHICAQRSIGGVYGPNGLMMMYADESSLKRNKIVAAEDVMRLFDTPTKYGDVNIFFFQHPDDTLRRSFFPFFSNNTPANSFKKISDSEYEIYIHDPATMVLFGQGKLKEGFGIGMKLKGDGGLNATNLMGEGIDSLLLKTSRQSFAYKVRSFNPFLDGLELYVRDKANDRQVLTFRIKFHFPAPVLSGITIDTSLIQRKKNNPSFEWKDQKENKNSNPGKITLSPKYNATLLAFEHFGSFRFSFLDNLQYKLDNAADWALTPLANTPSVLLENLSPGKHILYVRYPSEMAEVFTYEIEVKRSIWNSPISYIAGGILFSAVLFFLLYRARLRIAKDKATRTKLEMQAIQAQLNPHFVFNALGSIQYLMNRNDNKQADYYLTQLAKLLRHSLNNGEKELIPLSVELSMLDSYIRLEQMRFNFKYEMLIDDKVQTESLSTPPMLIQPLIENAIRHGISGMEMSGNLLIKVEKMNNYLVITISDNGRGCKMSHNDSGMGIRLVENRLKLLAKQHYHIDLTFSDGNPGTIVSVQFRNWT